MAKNKSSTAKSPSAQKIQAGPSGKMHKFGGAGKQAPGGSSVTPHAGKGASFVEPGPSNQMQKFTPVKLQKSGVSQVTNSGGRSSYAK